MTLDDLEALLRSERLDDAVEPYRYASADVLKALNDAVRQASIRKRLLFDSRTDTCCSYAIDADGEDPEWVELHKRVLAIRSARWSGSDCPLTVTTLRAMDKDLPDWPSEDAATPTHLIVDAQTGYVRLWPTPDADGTLALAVWRAPLESEEMEDGDDEPVIDETFHRDLIDWAEHLLLRTKDGEDGDTPRSRQAEADFTAKFGPLPTASAIQRWGVSPARGQRAEFT